LPGSLLAEQNRRRQRVSHKTVFVLPSSVEAVTLDFFNTLVFHREGRGRGRALMEYLEAQSFRTGPWEHQVLYDIFEQHDRAYSPTLDHAGRAAYLTEMAARVFARLGISVSAAESRHHADALWEILGPDCFEVFPDVPDALDELRARGTPLAVISNWQRGLRHFVTELGLEPYFHHIVGSADFGVAKPDQRIFLRAATLLDVPLPHILHVGDTLLDDYIGGESAGVQVVLIDRDSSVESSGLRKIRSLTEVPMWLDP
jgi:putative hydrolase of the HAD superfamily